MRNGDAYKIQSMAKTGVSDSEICHHFRNKYDESEVKRFIPVRYAKKTAPQTVEVEAETEAPKPKRKARTKKT